MEQIIHLFNQYQAYAVLLSLIINTIIAILGVIPSFFITGANIIFFGFMKGTFISFVGEAIGAIVSFMLYRRGFKRISAVRLKRYPKLKRLIELRGRKAFLTVLALRIMPFVPSGFVTMAAAIGEISLVLFSLSSSIGKFPALLLEAYSVYEVTSFSWQGKVILILIGIILLYKLEKSSH